MAADGWQDGAHAPVDPAPLQQATALLAAEAPQAEAQVNVASHAVPPEASDAGGAPPEAGARIGATGPHVWIQPKPSDEGLALGKVRIGTSVRLKQGAPPIPGPGCGRGWYAIEPLGYVCLGDRTTLNLDDPYYRALHTMAPERGALMPYRYAHSRGAPMYSRVPTPSEWAAAEAAYGKAGTYADLGEWAAGHEELIEEGKPIAATDAVPWYFAGGTRHVRGGNYDPGRLVWKVIPNGSMLAYGKAFEMHGRVWLVTPDLMIVPADRVQSMRVSTFEGVELGGDVSLPLAWNRGFEPIAIYQKKGITYEPSGETLAGKRWVEIADIGKGKFAMFGLPQKYFELRDRPGMFLKREDITISRERDELPPAFGPKDKWLDVKISPGTLTVYEGRRPVYATLFSPGKGGQPVPGLDHSRYATTQTGFFRFEWKDQVATMSNETGEPTVLWFSDVPHIQYIRAPLAMHVAYWHEDFANPKSAECVNLSPRDGRWLFNWTDPKLPDDWGAVRPGDGMGQSTGLMINGF